MLLLRVALAQSPVITSVCTLGEWRWGRWEVGRDSPSEQSGPGKVSFHANGTLIVFNGLVRLASKPRCHFSASLRFSGEKGEAGEGEGKGQGWDESAHGSSTSIYSGRRPGGGRLRCRGGRGGVEAGEDALHHGHPSGGEKTGLRGRRRQPGGRLRGTHEGAGPAPPGRAGL